jgi:hypothetical protein
MLFAVKDENGMPIAFYDDTMHLLPLLTDGTPNPIHDNPNIPPGARIPPEAVPYSDAEYEAYLELIKTNPPTLKIAT